MRLLLPTIPYLLFLCVVPFSGVSAALSIDQDALVVVCVPVADCLAISAREINATCPAETIYEHLSYSPEEGPYSCARIHQCLFNEVGALCQQTAEEVQVEFPHFFWMLEGKRYSRVWVLKSTVTPLTLVQRSLEVPKPLNGSFSTAHLNEDILSLSVPWHHDETNRTFSAGTRFARNRFEDQEKTCGIFVPDYIKNVYHACSLPRECLIESAPLCVSERKKMFIKLVRSWTCDTEEIIPYVWGGCSYMCRLPAADFFLDRQTEGTISIACWRRLFTQVPHGGMDCSGLILRAAQIVGIHHYFKNTLTIKECMTSILPNEELEEGDLILVPRHVMIVSDLKKNLLIDASSYTSEFGCAREVPLHKVFRDIATYEELQQAALQHIPLCLKTKTGSVHRTVDSLEFKRLAHYH